MITYHRARFRDAFEQETGLAGWYQRYAQLGPGRYRGSVETLAMPGIAIHRERINVAIEEETAGPEGKVLFAVPLSGEGSWRVDGDGVESRSLTLAPGGGEVLAAGIGPTDMLIVCVDAGLLDPDPGGAFPPARLRPGQEVEDFVEWMVALLARHGAGQAPDAADYGRVLPALVADRLHGLALAARGQGSAERPALSVHRRIRDYLEDQPGEPVSVAEIAAALGLRPALVRAAFEETVGVSPSEWIRRRRLNAVRRDLSRAGCTGRTVSEIAMTWGFWHLGRFARYYAAQFGETPSATVQRRRMV